MDYILPETNLVQIKTMEKLGNNGLFVIEPLSPGYGVTLGNSLRRVLLSSLEGAAITSVKIDGVTHEFATLPSVREDVVEIILNLKSLRFKMLVSEPVTMKLSVKGPKEVKAADFDKNSSCEVVDSEAFIASVGKSGKLSLEVVVEKGRGYVPVERRPDEQMPLGTIAVDSVFTPVKKIHYEVENTRVGGVTNFDKLTLEVATVGLIDPEEALAKATGILVEHFSLMKKAFTVKTLVVTPKKSALVKTKTVTKVKEAKPAKKTVKKV
jgi:DNA-directed RNA polymerase subunit alpha